MLNENKKSCVTSQIQRSVNRKEFLKTKENNLENVRELNKNAQIRNRLQTSQLHTTDHELL